MSKTTKSDTWMPLYIADYLRKTMHLTRDQHGAYMLLLMACWDRGGRLPNDPGQLAGIARATPAEWRKLSPVILPFFDVDGQYLTQGRVLEEREKAARLSEARRQSGLQGGRPRKQLATEQESKRESDEKPNGFANQKQDKTPTRVALPSPLTPPSEVSVPDGTVSDIRKSDLDAMWAQAPNRARERSSRKDLERSVRAAIRRGHTVDQIAAGLAGYYASREATKDGGEYAKGLHRMVENDRWQAFVVGDLASPTSPLDPMLQPEDWRQRKWMEEFVEGRFSWAGQRGPEPGQAGCRVAPEIQREFGVEPAPPVLASKGATA